MALKAIPAGNGARSIVPNQLMVQGTGAAFATGYVPPKFAAEDVPSLYAPMPNDTSHQRAWGPVTSANHWPQDVIDYATAHSGWDGANAIPGPVGATPGKTAFPWVSINLNIADIWPAAGVFHARDTLHGGDGLDNLIDAALDYCNPAATTAFPSGGLGAVLWLHPYVGAGAPSWVQTAAVPNGGSMINGSTSTYGNCPQTNSQGTGAVDCPVWWHPEMYRSAAQNGGTAGWYYDLMSRLAALYDSNPLFAGIVLSGPMTIFPEPMVRDLAGTPTGLPSTRTQILAGDGGQINATTKLLDKYGSFLKGPSSNPVALTTAGGGELDGSFVSTTLVNPDGSGSTTATYGIYVSRQGARAAANDVLAHYYTMKCHKAIWTQTRQQYAINPFDSLTGNGGQANYLNQSDGTFNVAQGNAGSFAFDNLDVSFDLARCALKIDGNLLISNESARFEMIPGGPTGHEWEVNPSTGLLKIFDANTSTSSPSQPGAKNLAYSHLFAGLRQFGALYFQQTASASTDPTQDRIGAGTGDWCIPYMKSVMIETPTAYNNVWSGVKGTLRSDGTNPNAATYSGSTGYGSGAYVIGSSGIPYKLAPGWGSGAYIGTAQGAPTDPSQDTTNWLAWPSGILPIIGANSVWQVSGVTVLRIQPGTHYTSGQHVVTAFGNVYQVKSGKSLTTNSPLDDTDDPTQDSVHWKASTDALLTFVQVSGSWTDPVTGYFMGWYAPFPQDRAEEFSPYHYYVQTTAMQALSTSGLSGSPPLVSIPLTGAPVNSGAIECDAVAGCAISGTRTTPGSSGSSGFTGVPGTRNARGGFMWPHAKASTIQVQSAVVTAAAVAQQAIGELVTHLPAIQCDADSDCQVGGAQQENGAVTAAAVSGCTIGGTATHAAAIAAAATAGQTISGTDTPAPSRFTAQPGTRNARGGFIWPGTSGQPPATGAVTRSGAITSTGVSTCTIGGSQTETGALANNATSSQTLGQSQTVTGALANVAVASQTLAGSDATTGGINATAVAASTIGQQQTVTGTLGGAGVAGQAVGATDTITAALGNVGAAAMALAGTDTTAGALACQGVAAMQVGGTDTINASLACAATGGQTLGGTDTLAAALAMGAVAAMAINGTVGSSITANGVGGMLLGGTDLLPGALACNAAGGMTLAGAEAHTGALANAAAAAMQLAGADTTTAALANQGTASMLLGGTVTVLAALAAAATATQALNGGITHPGALANAATGAQTIAGVSTLGDSIVSGAAATMLLGGLAQHQAALAMAAAGSMDLQGDAGPSDTRLTLAVTIGAERWSAAVANIDRLRYTISGERFAQLVTREAT